MNVRAHVLVSGRVQGVSYRSSTVDEARRLGIRGWVRNLPDGRVEAVFEGDKDAVEELVGWCRTGPPHARVAGVDVEWDEDRDEFRGFAVRR
ncbi:MAG TPA: acylphosphatase [Candidatus Methanoperedenaceae archaeon]|nr:acylphosphatase [Candidatus Methanoperedenaceae archaeon]